MKLIDVCKPIQIQNASQCAFIPFTSVPREYAGKTVRVVIVVEDSATVAAEAQPEPHQDSLLKHSDGSS